MSHQEYVGMKDLVFASPTMLAARRASMLRDGIGFLLLSTDEADHNVLLVPIAQNDPLNNVVDQTFWSGRFQMPCRVRASSSHPAHGDLVQVVVRPPALPGKQSEQDGSKSVHRHLCMNPFLAAYL
jgi:hypothetical protein